MGRGENGKHGIVSASHWWYYRCYKLDFLRSVFWQQTNRSLHPSLGVITLIILQKWQIEAPFSLWGDWVPNKQTKKKKKKERCQYRWDKQLLVLFIGPRCSWRENRLDNEEPAPSFGLLSRVNPPSLWIKIRPLVCVSLSRPLISHNPSFH